MFLGPLQGLQLPLELPPLLPLVPCDRRRTSDRPNQRCRQRESATLLRWMTSVFRRVLAATMGIGRTILGLPVRFPLFGRLQFTKGGQSGKRLLERSSRREGDRGTCAFRLLWRSLRHYSERQ